MHRCKVVSIADAQNVLEHEDTCLFDVREAGEAEKGHIPFASFLPRRLIEMRLKALVPNRRSHIIVYDDGEGDDRAARAAARISHFGWTNVAVLQDGMTGWTAAGHAVSKGSNVPSKEFGERLAAQELVPSVTASGLGNWRDSGMKLSICDVRTPEEFGRARIPGASSMPSFEIAGRLQALCDNAGPIVVNCAGRTRSIIACETLRLLGVSNVFALENGTMGWRLAGRDLDMEPSTGDVGDSAGIDALFEQRAVKLAADHGIQPMSWEAVEALLQGCADARANGYVFDVRRLTEFMAGHVEGCQALPGGQAVQRADEFVAVRGAPVVFVDQHEGRGAITAYWYRRMGYPRATYLKGGLAVWTRAGRKLVSGRGRDEPLGLDEALAKAIFVSAAELNAAMLADEPILVLHVENSREFADAHLPRSLWLPRGSLERGITPIATDKSARIVLTSTSEIQSIFAAEALTEMGFANVHVLRGGTRAWREAGYAVDTGLPEGVEKGSDIVLPPYARGLGGMQAYLDWEKALTHG